MSIANNFMDYKREIDWIVRQNPIECELYSIVATVMRERDSSREYSIRDVSALARQSKSDVIKADDRKYTRHDDLKGVSDFLIIDPNYFYSDRELKYIYGCIEVKAVYLEIGNDLDIQLKGELKTFKKLILTNGLKWIYYEYDESTEIQESKWEIELGDYQLDNKNVRNKISSSDIIRWNNVLVWHKLLNKINEIAWNKIEESTH